MSALRVVISGRVQGVWFRGWTLERAAELGLDGWVRNRRDGTVEALFAGPEAQVRAMVEACRRGPPLAKVVDLAEHPAEAPAEAGFYSLPTL